MLREDSNSFEQEYTSQMDQSYTQLKSDKSSSDEDQNQLNEKNSSEITFQGKQIKQCGCLSLNNYRLKSNDSLKFSNELLVTSDGILRMISNSSQISFGFSQQSVLKVEEKFNLGIVDIQFEKIKQLNQYTSQQAIKDIQNLPIVQNQKANDLILKYEQCMLFCQSQILDMNEQQEIFKEQELQFVIQYYFKVIEEYSKQNPNQMYSYNIGRISFGSKEFETVHSGFSQEYLNLLGLTEQSLSQIVLRKQQIDLMKDTNEITNQTLQFIESMYNFVKEMKNEKLEEYYTSHIVTFDGFPIKLHQKKNYFQFFESKFNFGLICEYNLAIVEMDVDLYDLENLIQYRQRITCNKKNLNLDDFIRKELSYQFEDVEYSVHSQSFIDKYYNKNINNLKQFKKDKIEQNQQKQCNYRLIS